MYRTYIKASQLTLFILYVFLMASCQPSKPATFITDKALFDTNLSHEASLDFDEPYGLKINSVPLEPKASVQISNPVFFNHFDRFLVFPGETIHVGLDERENYVLTVDGNPQRNKEFVFFKNFSACMMSDPRFTHLLYDTSLAKKQEQVINERLGQDKLMMLLLDSALAVDKISKRVGKIARTLYKSFSSENIYALYKRLQINENTYRLNFLNQVNTLQTLEEVQYGYNRLIDVFANELLTPDYLRSYNNLQKNIDAVNIYFKGIAKDYLLTTILLSMIERKVNISDTYFKQYYNLCKTKKYIRTIKNAQKRKLADDVLITRTGTNTLKDLNNNTTTLEQIIKGNKGKFILLDFWASWCLPCVQGFSIIKKILQSYRKEDIVVINLSFDKNVNSWKNAVKKYFVQPSQQFIFLDSRQSNFVIEHKIEEIPRYMFFDRNGKLLEDNMPYPDESGFTKILEKHVKQ